MAIHVKSEIGKLKKVMLHRPGQELEHLVPEDLERLLFDDIPYLKTAKIEHDMFAEIMQGQGVEVVYLEDLTSSLTQVPFRLQYSSDIRITAPSLLLQKHHPLQ